MMRLLIVIPLLALAFSCSKRNAELTETCSEIIEADTFYFAMPPFEEWQLREMYLAKNHLASTDEKPTQTIDYDCVVIVSPTDEKMEELRKTGSESFDIGTRHVEAGICIIESKGIRTTRTAEGILRFVSTSRTWNLDVQREHFLYSDWKLILFRQDKDPIIVPSMLTTVEVIDEYFGGMK